MGKSRKVLPALAAILSTFAFSLRLELYQGFDENTLLSIFNKLYNSFASNALLEVVAVLGLFFFYKEWMKKETGFDLFTAIFSLVLSFLFVLSTFYAKFDASDYMFANVYQLGMTVLSVVGMALFFYALLRMILLKNKEADTSKETFF